MLREGGTWTLGADTFKGSIDGSSRAQLYCKNAANVTPDDGVHGLTRLASPVSGCSLTAASFGSVGGVRCPVVLDPISGTPLRLQGGRATPTAHAIKQPARFSRGPYLRRDIDVTLVQLRSTTRLMGANEKAGTAGTPTGMHRNLRDPASCRTGGCPGKRPAVAS